MYPFDYHQSRKLAQKRVGKRQRRSEAEHRLYWSTYRRLIERQAQAPGKIRKVWMGLRWLLGVVWELWAEHLPFNRRIGEQGSQKHLLGSEQGDV
jgi:hypothetical protein